MCPTNMSQRRHALGPEYALHSFYKRWNPPKILCWEKAARLCADEYPAHATVYSPAVIMRVSCPKLVVLGLDTFVTPDVVHERGLTHPGRHGIY